MKAWQQQRRLRRCIKVSGLAFKFVLAMGLAGCFPKPAPPEVSTANLDASAAKLIQSSREAVIQSPTSAEIWGKLGEAFHTVEFFPEARICYTQAGTLNPNTPKWPHLLGLLELQDQPQAAISNLNRAVSLNHGGADVSGLPLVRALLEQGRAPEAETQLQGMLRMNQNHPGARLEMARLQFARGQFESAAEFLQPCLTNYYTARAAHVLLSQVRLRQGDQAGSAVLSQRAAQMARPFDWPDPFLREVQSLRADRQKLQDQANGALMQHRFKDAESILGQLFKAFPDDPEGLLLLGRLRFQQRRCPESEQALRRYLQLQPDSLNGLMQVSLALLCQQRWVDAITVLQQATTLKPDFGQAWYNLGFAFSNAGNSDAAITNLNQALRCSPGDVPAHVALAEEYLARKEQLQAMQHLNQALELDPGNKAARALRQRIQQQQQ
jgi:tetratricopeptide (TPR) repeat protein